MVVHLETVQEHEEQVKDKEKNRLQQQQQQHGGEKSILKFKSVVRFFKIKFFN